MVLTWENLWRFLWCWSSFCCCYSSFVNVLHSHFLFDIIPHPSVDYRQVFKPILYFQPSPLQSDSRHFHFSTIPLPPYCEGYGFEWVFFTHRRFLPYAPSWYFWHNPDLFGTFLTFWHNLLLSRFHWELAVTFWKLQGSYCSSKHTPSPSVWFTVIHNLLYIWSLYLCMSILQKFYLW